MTPTARRRRAAIGLFLVAATLAVYAQTRHHDFINYDDPEDVAENPHVLAGLSLEGLRWALTTRVFVYPIPLTALSHMLDGELYGRNAGGHHLTSVLLHVANALLLFAVLDRMTGAPWRSGFVAALFALHPLHVESVAWVSERKDVLSTLFAILTLWTYVRWVERPASGRYGAVVLALALGLLAKPMLVTVPFLLLLLDYWPLGRLSPPAAASFRRLVLEKVPLLALAAAASATTLVASRAADALVSLERTPVSHRIARALVAYVAYIGKTIWPSGLAVFYPDTATGWEAAGAAVVLAGVTIAVARSARRRPYLAVGWLWYLGTLVPVIGLVQNALHGMADRYTYLPLVGLFVIVAWGAADLASRWHLPTVALRCGVAIALAACATLTWLQVQHWHDSTTLFRHALAVTTDNFVAHNNLGEALVKERRIDEAMAHFVEAVRIRPTSVEAHNNLGAALYTTGRLDEARAHFSELVRLKPAHAPAHNNLGVVLEDQGLLEQAIVEYGEALRLEPGYARARRNLETARAKVAGVGR